MRSLTVGRSRVRCPVAVYLRRYSYNISVAKKGDAPPHFCCAGLLSIAEKCSIRNQIYGCTLASAETARNRRHFFVRL